MGETEIGRLKDVGNNFFNEGNYVEALSHYTKAINLTNNKDVNKVALHKNRAAVYLKLREYENAVNDCTAALESNPNDTKALFRRCQALEQLERWDEAFKDAKLMFTLEPKNSAFQPVIARLHAKIQEVAKEQLSTTSRIKQMFDLTFKQHPDTKMRLKAANNLVVLAREKGAADMMMKENVVPKMVNLMRTEKNTEILTACVRAVGELCKDNEARTKTVIHQIGVPQMVEALNSPCDKQVTAAQTAIQTVLNSLSGMDIKEMKKPDPELLKKNDVEIDSVMKVLTYAVGSRSMSAIGRDAVIQLVMRNVDFSALNWGEKLLETDGIQRLLDVSSEIKEYKNECSLLVTDETRAITAIALQHAYDCLSADKFREMFREKVDLFVKDKLKGGDVEPKVQVTAAITTLLQGAVDVGNYCLAQQGVLEMMLVMAGTEDPIQQMVAAEALIAAAGKKDKCSSILSLGVNILKKLFQSKNDNIRVRALVGLCKLGSMGGADASIKPFADGSTQKLAEACRKFLVNPAKDRDIRKWAAEGLSYLTLDGDIKEELIEDTATVRALIELAKTGDQTVVYGVVMTFVNLTNSYDKQEVLPEMIQLAKFAKQHIPTDHPMDSPEVVLRRVRALTELGVTTALVALSKTDSKNSKELIARIFNAICEQQELRGKVVQDGGAKILIPLALDGTESGKKTAAQAIARIAISINPEVAFPGQRCAEAARPIIQLLHPDCNGLQNFEALLALCNLAQVSQTVRNSLIKDSKFCQIEHYMYEDHEYIKRAATQCMVNLITHDNVIKLCEGENDRVKYWTLLCQDEDFETAKAAAGGLAMLTEASEKCCSKVFEAKAWLDSLRYLLANESSDMQYRGTCIIDNMMNSADSVAQQLIDTDIMELLMAITKLEEPDRAKAKIRAESSLQSAKKRKLIRPTTEADE